MLLYESLAMRLREQIERGTLRAGERLPSIRQLAANHGISAATAVQACLQLEREGRVQARPRAGYFVRATAVASPAALPAPRRRTPGMVDHPALQRVLDTVARTDLLPLHTATPAPALLPAAHLAAALSRQLRRQRTAALDYAPPQGHAALRRQIAQRYAHCATSVTADEVVITAGAMEAISLALRTLAMPGDVVLVETPTYHGILQAMAALRLKVLEVPNRSGQGIDIARLESLLQRTKVRAAVLVPNFNNPIGSLTPDSAKRALLDSCARHGTVVIEDDIYGELDWSGQRPRPLRHFDTHANVITCGSFSKVLAPGLRVGWLLGGRLDRRTGARQVFFHGWQCQPAATGAGRLPDASRSGTPPAQAAPHTGRQRATPARCDRAALAKRHACRRPRWRIVALAAIARRRQRPGVVRSRIGRTHRHLARAFVFQPWRLRRSPAPELRPAVERHPGSGNAPAGQTGCTMSALKRRLRTFTGIAQVAGSHRHCVVHQTALSINTRLLQRAALSGLAERLHSPPGGYGRYSVRRASSLHSVAQTRPMRR